MEVEVMNENLDLASKKISFIFINGAHRNFRRGGGKIRRPCKSKFLNQTKKVAEFFLFLLFGKKTNNN